MRIAVVGAGIVGLATTFELIKQGQQVDCFEAGRPMAARSCGDARIFRLAHAEPALVDLARQARSGWQTWSEAAGEPLVGGEGTVVSGDIDGIVAAMSEAGARFEVSGTAVDLPACAPVGPFLRDRFGGVIRAARTGAFLLADVRDRLVERAVTGIGLDGDAAVLTVDGVGELRYDSVVVAAGAATPGLVGSLGIVVSDRLEHHVRFTFPLRDGDARPPCWIDRSQAWRPGFTSYGQLAAPGRWAVGGHLPARDTAWELPVQDAIERARQVIIEYVRDQVTACEPEAVDSLYCTVTSGLDDGLPVARVGPVLAVWGSNLFKFAPVLGRNLARAAMDLALPAHVAITPRT